MQTDMLERHLPRLIEELADEHTPDYYDDLFWQTARTSQRPAWTVRERWFPMLEIARRPVTARMPWQPIAVLVLIVVALATSLLLAGTRPKPAPLTGPAGNGLIAYSRDGDIYTYDARVGTSRAIVTGGDFDLDPVWSVDGTRMVFRRVVDGADVLFVAKADGGSVRRITPEGLTNVQSYEISPDGTSVAIVASIKGRPSLFVAKADGSGIEVVATDTIVWGAAFRPTGSDILFVGPHGMDGSYSGVYVIDVDGTNLRTLVQPQVDANLLGDVTWSPDGTRIAYARWEPNVVHQNLRVHVMAADGTGDRVVGHADGAWWESGPVGSALGMGVKGGPLWSPDGTKLLIERVLGTIDDVIKVQLPNPVVVTVDASAPDVVVGFQATDYGIFAAWSPDGSAILATPLDKAGNPGQQLLWDPTTGASRPAPWLATSHPAWQRVAP
jgi:Tol biopolymer transport system component